MRTLLKRSIETFTCRSGLTRALRSMNRNAVFVLAYHNVVPEGEHAGGDISLHLSQREFGRQLDLVARTHEVVPLPVALEPVESRRRPRAVITFDDAYEGTLTAGVKELSRRGLPATIFVAPAFVGGKTFWWDTLARLGALPEEVRSHALEACAGKDAFVRGWATVRGLDSISPPEHMRVASEERLAEAVAVSGITLGSHTWSHVNLSRVHGEELRGELERPLAWLRERFDSIVPWLTYPYGLYSPEAERIAEEVGYEGALRVDGGRIPLEKGNTQHYSLPRINVPSGVTIAGFEMRTSGLLG